MYDVLATAARIKSLRLSQGITQEELAVMANVTRGHIYKLEAGTKVCSIDLAIVLSDVFKVTLDYLILGKENKISDTQRQLDSIISQLSALRSSL